MTKHFVYILIPYSIIYYTFKCDDWWLALRTYIRQHLICILSSNILEELKEFAQGVPSKYEHPNALIFIPGCQVDLQTVLEIVHQLIFKHFMTWWCRFVLNLCADLLTLAHATQLHFNKGSLIHACNEQNIGLWTRLIFIRLSNVVSASSPRPLK